MYGQHDLGSLVHQRNEEALQDAHTRRLAKQARAATSARGLRGVGLAWRSALEPLLRGVRLTG